MARSKVISGFEVVPADDVGRRRVWTVEEKIRIVEESLRGRKQGAATARRLGVCRSQLTRWRADYRAGRLLPRVPTFTAVTIAAGAAPVPAPGCGLPTSKAVAPAVADATIEIVLRNGRRMIVPAWVDPAVLPRLLAAVDAP